jgi:hypothetical protein
MNIVFNSFSEVNPALSNRITHPNDSPILFWRRNENFFQGPAVSFGDYSAKNDRILLYKGMGDKIDLKNAGPNDTLDVGTIGADFFQNKILIIDYPNHRFALCDTPPSEFNSELIDIQLDHAGRVILPMKLKGKSYRILFDNGSSIFPLLVSKEKIGLFTNTAPIDTNEISSWGKLHNVMGRPLKDTFRLANQTFSNITAYTDFRDDQNALEYDAITGNQLFWNKTILIDFKNKKFGVK